MKLNDIRFFNPVWIVVLAVVFLAGCGNRFEEEIATEYKTTQSNLNYLKGQLDSKQLINGLLIEKYSRALVEQKPDYSELALLLRKEATAEGKNYAGLLRRLEAVNLSPTEVNQAAGSRAELRLISSAADVYEYNNGLADVVNTLAALSDGALPVISVPASHKQTAAQTNAMVGNPSYGQWKTESSGRSFWEWYGMYSMFSNVLGGRSYYGNWSSRPHYSYYGEYGRNRWGSDADVSRNQNLSSRHPSKYNKPSATTKARYAKTSTRSSSYGGSGSKSSSGSRSSKSRTSAYGSSSRSSSFSSSRSSRSGK